MSGLAGYFLAKSDQCVSSRVLDSMMDALPGGADSERRTFVAGSIGFGSFHTHHATGNSAASPTSSDDRTIHVAFDGTIYNAIDLSNELEKAGCRFRGDSATEVVIHGYRYWGIDKLCNKLNGAFAFCIWDAKESRAYLVRDRVGSRPLYYSHRNRRFAFASKLRSLARSGLVQPRIDETALIGYLNFQFSPDERTLLSGAYRVPAGQILEWRDGRINLRQYWSLPATGEDSTLTQAERTEAIRVLLWEIVERQLKDDAPACFLGGGSDSAIIAAMLSKSSSQRLRTYSAVFPGNDRVNESATIDRIVASVKSQHTSVEVSESDLLANIDGIASSMDEPIADPSLLPAYLVSKAACDDFSSVFAGYGADEVFAGYRRHRDVLTGAYTAINFDHIDRLNDWIGVSYGLGGRLDRITFPLPQTTSKSQNTHYPFTVDSLFLWNLLSPDRRPVVERIDTYIAEVEHRVLGELASAPLSALQRACALDLRMFVSNNTLPMIGGLTGAHGLDSRLPYLDHRLIELAFNLPASFKVGPDREKHILREAARDLFPADVVNRPHNSLSIPLHEWLSGPLQHFVRSLLTSSPLISTGLFDQKALDALYIAHVEVGVDLSRIVWTLVCLSQWYSEMLEWFADSADENVEVSTPEVASHTPRSFVERIAECEDTEPGRCDIVMPIYGGLNYVKDAVRSILRHTHVPYRLILVDDSACEATFAALQEIAAWDSRIELLRNEENLGFVKTANRGMEYARAEYVCLVNSDIIVSEGWLDRMIRCAETDPKIAVVNPLSNMSVNLSVQMAPGLNLNTMSKRLVRCSQHRYPDLTTAVGYCMLIRRKYLEFFGGFDEIFGAGYCEESDFCMRLTEEGLRVVAAEDAFVYHKGSGSFGTWIERYNVNRKIFDRRWAYAYERDYDHFLRRNPLQYVRDALLRNTIKASEYTLPVSYAVDRFDRDQSLRRSAGPLNGDPHISPETTPGSLVRYVNRRPRTKLDPSDREIRFPTRSYIERIPNLDSLRITFLIADSMPICGGVICITQLAREMIIAGHDVKIATTAKVTDPEIFNLPSQPLVYPDKDELIRLFPESDVVLATYWTTAFELMPRLRKQYDFVSGYYVQDYEAYFYPEHDVVNRTRAAATYTMTENRIVMSQWLKELIERKHGVACDKIHLGLDLGVFRNRRSNNQLNERPRILSNAHPNVARRGFDDAIQAFRQIHAVRPEVEFLFFGIDDEELPKDLPVPVTNVGRIYDPNRVAALISSCDFLLDSSHFQGFGRPGLEAMACGTVTVLTNAGGVNEYAKDGVNSMMVNPRDPEAMADRLLRLMYDNDLRVRLSEAGLQTAKEYCHIDEAERHIDLYRDWIRRKYNNAPSIDPNRHSENFTVS